MDQPLERSSWVFSHWPLPVKVGVVIASLVGVALLAVKLIAGSEGSTLRMPVAQLQLSEVEQGVFHDLIPLRAHVEPLETVYVDAVDGGRVDRVLVEAGDLVKKHQPLLELSNGNLALSVIQQESQLNQAISQLQQNEISLEQNALANSRALAEIEYQISRLTRANSRRENLLASGAVTQEQHDEVADDLAYYRRLLPIQKSSNERQSNLRERLLPDIQRQLSNLRNNLDIVQGKLSGLVIRAPVDGVVSALNVAVGEHRSPGDRLAEVTPESGMKLTANVDEYYLSRVRTGQRAVMDIGDEAVRAVVRRVSPQVRDGRFSIDLEFEDGSPAALVAGGTAQGRLQLGGDSAAVVVPVGLFMERTGGNWAFVVSKDGKSAERRQIKIGRRSSEQLEILSGVVPGERVITSDYTGIDRADRIVLTD